MLGFDRYLFLFALFIIHSLRWNRNERDFLYFLNIIPNRGIVLDVGANIGIMSVWLGRRLKNAQILAFEPIPHNIKALKRVLKHYKLNNVQVIEKALGNRNGETEMIMPVLDDVKMQGLSHVVHESIQDFNEGKKYKASMMRLDDCEHLKDDSIELTAIKLDVENFEYFTLDGARRLIKKHKPLIYTELWENENREKCFELLTSYGYTIKVVHQNKVQLYNPEQHHTQNFFFVP